MSKNAFKRALGHLLKEGKIEIGENRIEIQKREVSMNENRQN